MPNRHSRRVRSRSILRGQLVIVLLTVAGCGAQDEHRRAERNDVAEEGGALEDTALDLPDRARELDAPQLEALQQLGYVGDVEEVDEVDEALVVEIPAAVTPLELIWVPGGEFLRHVEGEATTVAVDGFWMSRTEIPWEMYDVLVHRLDLPDDESSAEAETRPSKPYISMDRGFGHKGYPAISLSAKGGEAFCAWLSEQTGRRFRLPTVDEWEYACVGGGTLRFPPAIEVLDERAWHRGNAGFKTHPVAQLEPNAYGLYDLLGNAAEWALGPDGPVVCGGSYRDPRERLGPGYRVPADPNWNASDPQIPKSVWWLADAGFIGLRVVCEE